MNKDQERYLEFIDGSAERLLHWVVAEVMESTEAREFTLAGIKLQFVHELELSNEEIITQMQIPGSPVHQYYYVSQALFIHQILGLAVAKVTDSTAYFVADEEEE